MTGKVVGKRVVGKRVVRQGVVRQAGHLARRFVGSLSRSAISPADLAWVADQLSSGELALWQRFGVADQRHTLAIARSTLDLLPADRRGDRRIVVAALMHDIGKLDAGLGTLGRIAATLWSAVRGEAAAEGEGRFARYLRHEPIGASWCAALGCDPLVVALVGGDEAADPIASSALRAADDAV